MGSSSHFPPPSWSLLSGGDALSPTLLSQTHVFISQSHRGSLPGSRGPLIGCHHHGNSLSPPPPLAFQSWLICGVPDFSGMGGRRKEMGWVWEGGSLDCRGRHRVQVGLDSGSQPGMQCGLHCPCTLNKPFRCP